MNVYGPSQIPPSRPSDWCARQRLMLIAWVVMLSACGGGNTTTATSTSVTTPVVTAPTCTAPQVLSGSVCVTLNPSPTASLLTDTGITASQCYAAGSNALTSCTSAAALALNDKQDGMLGRDVSTPDNADGKLGFSYSTVPNPAGGSFAVTECVKDNITGLTWEGKTATGPRAGSATFTNYDSTAQAQFSTGITFANMTFVNPSQAQIDASTNAVGYKNAVNASALCGYTDWRLPTADELQSLVDYSVDTSRPTLDVTWFPNTPGYVYWSASPYAGDVVGAWVVNFNYGRVVNYLRYNAYHVRLVR
ncbi:MAG: hypothetical protein FD135_2960 [Comamonadaceae bacterium]|nr:MAG: hypothetical protein FD135_2960 [Comamonadaceae bacterium]